MCSPETVEEPRGQRQELVPVDGHDLIRFAYGAVGVQEVLIQ